jgi:dTDP-4-amino-4,6-dideoxygalactose transaminase
VRSALKLSPSVRKIRKPRRAGRSARNIPVLRPQLPRAERLLPYLHRIDSVRIYTNWGPLSSEFEKRLAKHFGLGEKAAVVASSGTAALVAAILATSGRGHPDRPLAMIPAFTFVATACAVEQCGYQPYLVDVDAESWLLEAGRLDSHPRLNQVGLVVPVAAFGRPVAQKAWLAFHRRTGIPVVIDGAASFEAISDHPRRSVGRIPTVLSFHATKSFGIGEGGCVLTTDRALSKRTTQALNFGFYGSRNSQSAGSNGKMSEYHAAIGLAELDGWLHKRRMFMTVAARYRERMTTAGLGARLVSAPDVASCYVLFHCSDPVEAAQVQKSLVTSRIGFRLWYGNGLLNQPSFCDAHHDPLDVTDAIAPCYIGLPVAVDLSDSDVSRIVAALRRGVG